MDFMVNIVENVINSTSMCEKSFHFLSTAQYYANLSTSNSFLNVDRLGKENSKANGQTVVRMELDGQYFEITFFLTIL